MMSFARSWKLKLGSWAASEGCRPLKLSTGQAAERLRVMGVHGPALTLKWPLGACSRQKGTYPLELSPFNTVWNINAYDTELPRMIQVDLLLPPRDMARSQFSNHQFTSS